MKVALLGFGTVGKGVYDMLCGSDFLSPSLVLVREGKVTEPFEVSDIRRITEDPEIEAVAECMGGIHPAFEYVKACLEAHKSVVTANKALVAEKGLELTAVARDNGVGFLFSAACGGAIPVLHNIAVAKRTDRIRSCVGIINGTCNFILSGLEDSSFASYTEALEKAQQLGYAEADPTADVSGLDTLRKVILLCAVAFDRLPSDGFDCEGIENIDLYEGEGRIRLLGQCGLNEDGSVHAFVEPCVVSEASGFAGVVSNGNRISYTGERCGEISISGQGAGRYPTASALLRDLSAVSSPEYMIGTSCIAQSADNSRIGRDYVVFKDGQKAFVKCSVSEMHAWAASEREKGSRVFFACVL